MKNKRLAVDDTEIKYKKVRRSGKWKTATQEEIDAENLRRQQDAFADHVIGSLEKAQKEEEDAEEKQRQIINARGTPDIGVKVKVCTHILGMYIDQIGEVTGNIPRELEKPKYEGTVIVKFENGEEELFDERDLELVKEA